MDTDPCTNTKAATTKMIKIHGSQIIGVFTAILRRGQMLFYIFGNIIESIVKKVSFLKCTPNYRF